MNLNHQSPGGGRLSTVLRREMQVSAGLMNRLKWEERILVNGIPRHTDYPVMPGDTVTLILDEEEPQYPAEDTPVDILYEDDAILAVDKAPGVLIHPSRHRDTGTLANAVIGYYQKTGQKCAFHPVTRLDRDTYGVVLLAKTSHVHAMLNAAHAEGRLEKYYQALVYGGPEEPSGIIDAPIDRRPLPSLLRYVSDTGKPCRTEFRVLKTWENRSLLELRPLTGRTHQLRVHCAHRGFPILGDPQYGSEESRALSEALGFSYQRLCARRLEFFHPMTGERLVIESKKSAEKTPDA